MTQIDHHRLRALFESVMDRPPSERVAILDEACADNRALREELESLLRHHDANVSVLADDQAGFGMKMASDVVNLSSEPTMPVRIGVYRLVRELGSGGMGIVYEAEQERPVRRNVALKVIKLGMDTQEVVARFRQERQALAMLDHPNIAKVLDAGATESGRPFFVMELCTGERITEYCDSRHLPIKARLQLFIQVCQAIQHAHQKALIHRDIKPSNVLVSTQDEHPIAKVIDFGIAKAMGDPLSDLSLHTLESRLIGTPEYMSPEQADGRRDIDTRTDVYSLGVLLYELLTGSTPFGGQHFASASLTNMIRIIREVEPVRPSTRVRESTSRMPQSEISHERLPSILRGDLDWIVTKAIEKDPSRRYASAGALADDVRRYLVGDPVDAAPPSSIYRLRKFTRRNRGLVAGVGLVSAALIVGAMGTLWQASVARREAQAARSAENDARRIAEFQARMLEHIDTALAGDDLLSDIRTQFEREILKAGLSDDAKVAKIGEFEEQLQQLNGTDLAANLIDSTILRPSIESVSQEFSDQPVIEASLNQTLATLYYTIGRYAAARPLQEKALETRKRVLGESHPDTLTSKQSLAGLMRLLGDLDGASSLANATFKECRESLGADHPITLKTQSMIGGLFRMKGRIAEAEACWREVLERRRQSLGQDDRETIISLNNLGMLLAERFELSEAEALYREALERGIRVNGEDHPNTLITQHFLAGLLWRENRMDEAEALYRDTLDKRRRLLGDSHPRTINSILNLGEFLLATKRFPEAEPLLQEAYEKCRTVRGNSHPLTLSAVSALTTLLEEESRWGDAEPLLRILVSGLVRTKGESSSETTASRLRLGRTLLALERFDEAESLLTSTYRFAVGAENQEEAMIQSVEMLIRLYEAWNIAAPSEGHDQQTAYWMSMRKKATETGSNDRD